MFEDIFFGIFKLINTIVAFAVIAAIFVVLICFSGVKYWITGDYPYDASSSIVVTGDRPFTSNIEKEGYIHLKIENTSDKAVVIHKMTYRLMDCPTANSDMRECTQVSGTSDDIFDEGATTYNQGWYIPPHSVKYYDTRGAYYSRYLHIMNTEVDYISVHATLYNEHETK